MSSSVPGGWEIKTVGDIGLVVTGSTPSTTEPRYWNGEIPFISPADFDGTVYIKNTSRMVTSEGAEKGRLLPENAILVTCIGSLGGMAMSSRPSVTNQQINSVVAKHGQDSRFHFYNILFNIHELTRNAGTTTLPIINKSTFSLISLLFPPLPEQQKIAAILSTVDDVIEKTRAQIDKLKDLKNGMMQELLTKGIGHTEFKDSPMGRIPVGWNVATTGEVSKSIVPGRNKPKSLVGEIPWLTITDLDEIYVRRSKANLGVTREILKEASGKTIPKGSVIMTVVGEFGISSVALCEMVINQQLHGFVCNDDVNPTFLCLSLRYHKLQIGRLATQTTIAYMNKDNAESVLFAKPPIKEQEAIVSAVMSVDEKLKAVRAKCEALQSTKKALMQDLLTGNVRVKIDDKESAVA